MKKRLTKFILLIAVFALVIGSITNTNDAKAAETLNDWKENVI